MRTNTGSTRRPAEPPGRICAQGTSPHITPHVDNVARASERSLTSGKQGGLGQGVVRHRTYPGSGGGPSHEDCLLSLKALQQTTSREGQILPFAGVQQGLWRMGSQNRRLQTPSPSPPRQRPGRGSSHGTSNYGNYAPRSMEQTQTAETRKTGFTDAMALARTKNRMATAEYPCQQAQAAHLRMDDSRQFLVPTPQHRN